MKTKAHKVIEKEDKKATKEDIELYTKIKNTKTIELLNSKSIKIWNKYIIKT